MTGDDVYNTYLPIIKQERTLIRIWHVCVYRIDNGYDVYEICLYAVWTNSTNVDIWRFSGISTYFT